MNMKTEELTYIEKKLLNVVGAKRLQHFFVVQNSEHLRLALALFLQLYPSYAINETICPLKRLQKCLLPVLVYCVFRTALGSLKTNC